MQSTTDFEIHDEQLNFAVLKLRRYVHPTFHIKKIKTTAG